MTDLWPVPTGSTVTPPLAGSTVPRSIAYPAPWATSTDRLESLINEAIGTPSVFVVGNGVTPQTIDNATWTNVNFAFALSDDGYPTAWSASEPSKIHLMQEGYTVQLAEVAWTPNATGRRRMRWILDGDEITIACEDDRPGIGPATGFIRQHQQCYCAGPVTEPGLHYSTVQVWQDSGGPLNLVPDGFAAPQVMLFLATSHFEI